MRTTRDAARAFCRTLKRETRGYGVRWRAIAQIADRAGVTDPAPAIAAAVEAGWIEVVNDRSACLTPEGRDL